MTVESTARKASFNMDGVTVDFDFTFRALVSSPEDIKCKVTDGDGNVTDLTYTTDYSVAVNADGVGGTVTVNDAESEGCTLTVYRETTQKQQSDYEDYNQFPADTLEEDLDRLMCLAQETAEDTGRTLKLPITSDLSDVEVPEPESNKLIGWNAAGDGLENKEALDADVAAQVSAYATAAAESAAAAAASAAEAEAVAGFSVDTDGALTANSDEKIASQKATKTYADTKASDGDITSYGDSSTIVGWSSYSIKNLYYKKVGKLVFVLVRISGESNSAEVTFTLPDTVSTLTQYGMVSCQNNGGAHVPGLVKITASGSTITIYQNLSSGAWTASGTKGVQGQFCFVAS